MRGVPGAAAASHSVGAMLRAPSRSRVLVPAAVLASLGLAAALPSAASAADPADLKSYYDIFDRGDTQIPGHDTTYTPQGLAYWPEQDALIISYYDSSKKKKSRLAVIDRATGAAKKTVALPTKGHVGGLATFGKYVYVSNGGAVTRIRKTTLLRKQGSSPIKTAGTKKVKASSYMTITGNQMWVGNYKKNSGSTAYRYTLSKSGVPKYSGTKIATPKQVQGMAIVGDTVIWSRSTGRDERSTLDSYKLSSSASNPITSFVAPNMSEGLAIAGSELHVVYESGSATYDDADYRVRTVQHGPFASFLGR